MAKLSPERPASAKLAGQSYAPSLGFGGKYNSFNLGHNGIESIGGRLTANKWDIAKDYREGNLHFVVKCAAGSDRRKYDLVFVAVPSRANLTRSSHNC